MLKLLTDSLGKVGFRGLGKNDLSSSARRLRGYLKGIHKRNQWFYRALDDKETLRKIEAYATSVKGRYQFIVVLGIGGSALGTICLKEALKPTADTLSKNNPELLVLDNIDPVQITALEAAIDLKKTLFLVVTKSGGTPETLATYLYFRDKVQKAKRNVRDHFLFITDPEKGFLRHVAHHDNIPSFSVPPGVGGRFSVLTTVGLVPAALMGLDIRALVRGGRKMRARFLSEDPKKNLSFQLATVQYELYRKGKMMNVLIPYSSRLDRLSDWFRQLLAESTGKERRRLGHTRNVGLTPLRALGVTDQHSQFQLYNQGPNDKLILFVEVKDHGPTLQIPNLHRGEEALAFLRGRSFQQLLFAELQASREALIRYKRPSLTIQIDRVDEEHLGMLFMLFQGATAFLGEYLGIDAFDQPGVELGKQLTKKRLAKT